MKKFSPYVGAGLVLSMFYMLYQMKQVSESLEQFSTTLRHPTVLTLFSICGILGMALSWSGFESLDTTLKMIAYIGFGGSALITLVVWFFPFFV